jgi:hypothetical protein
VFAKRWNDLTTLVGELRHSVDLLDRRAEKMETILMVREPASVTSAEAYEGLRKQVVNAVSERLAHLSQLVQLDAALRNGADGDVLAKLADGWFEQASITRVVDPDHLQFDMLFDLISDGGGAVEVIEPAYVDIVTGRVIRLGRAQRLAPAQRPDSVPLTPVEASEHVMEEL